MILVAEREFQKSSTRLLIDREPDATEWILGDAVPARRCQRNARMMQGSTSGGFSIWIGKAEQDGVGMVL